MIEERRTVAEKEQEKYVMKVKLKSSILIDFQKRDFLILYQAKNTFDIFRSRLRKMDKREEKQKWDDRHWTQKDLSQVRIDLLQMSI